MQYISTLACLGRNSGSLEELSAARTEEEGPTWPPRAVGDRKAPPWVSRFRKPLPQECWAVALKKVFTVTALASALDEQTMQLQGLVGED